MVTEVDGPSRRPGDLVALVGLGDDATGVVQDMVERLGVLPGCAGLAGAAGLLRLDSRRDAREARAGAVRAGRPVVLAVGIGPDGGIAAELLSRLSPDEVWVVVDASRKPDDTQTWVDVVRRIAPVRAMAVVGRELTATPETVDVLGLPVGWDAADIAPWSSIHR